jgi:hypothetical protein
LHWHRYVVIASQRESFVPDPHMLSSSSSGTPASSCCTPQTAQPAHSHRHHDPRDRPSSQLRPQLPKITLRERDNHLPVSKLTPTIPTRLISFNAGNSVFNATISAQYPPSNCKCVIGCLVRRKQNIGSPVYRDYTHQPQTH